MRTPIHWTRRCHDLAAKKSLLHTSGNWIQYAFPHLLSAVRQVDEGQRRLSPSCIGQITTNLGHAPIRARFAEETTNPYGSNGLKVYLIHGPRWGSVEDPQTLIGQTLPKLRSRFREEVSHWIPVPFEQVMDVLQMDTHYKSRKFRYIILIDDESPLDLLKHISDNFEMYKNKNYFAVVFKDREQIKSYNQEAIHRLLNVTHENAKETWQEIFSYFHYSTLCYDFA